MLEPVPANKEAVVSTSRNVSFKGSLAVVTMKWWSSRFLGKPGWLHSKLTNLDFRRADFGLFRKLFGGVLWDKGLKRKEAQESWLIFKDHLLQCNASQQRGSQTKTGLHG